MNVKAKVKKQLKKDNAEFPKTLVSIPLSEWPYEPNGLLEVWRSKDFLVQIYDEGDYERMSVCSTRFNGERWVDGIKWDDLQRLKRECGRGGRAAVEAYPPDVNIVNVANMRHLWILPSVPKYFWSSDREV